MGAGGDQFLFKETMSFFFFSGNGTVTVNVISTLYCKWMRKYESLESNGGLIFRGCVFFLLLSKCF